MFLFGDVSDTARTYLEYVMGEDPRRFSDVHFDEMSLSELDNALVWLLVSVKQSIREGVDESIQEVLLAWYDEAFEAHVRVSDKILKAIKANKHVPPTGRKDLPKYTAIAEAASES